MLIEFLAKPAIEIVTEMVGDIGNIIGELVDNHPEISEHVGELVTRIAKPVAEYVAGLANYVAKQAAKHVVKNNVHIPEFVSRYRIKPLAAKVSELSAELVSVRVAELLAKHVVERRADPFADLVAKHVIELLANYKPAVKPLNQTETDYQRRFFNGIEIIPPPLDDERFYTPPIPEGEKLLFHKLLYFPDTKENIKAKLANMGKKLAESRAKHKHEAKPAVEPEAKPAVEHESLPVSL